MRSHQEGIELGPGEPVMGRFFWLFLVLLRRNLNPGLSGRQKSRQAARTGSHA